jgi:hypothetical protein
MTALEKLKEIVRRTEGMAPVVYRIEVPGALAIQLNYLAIQNGRTVDQEILDAIDLQTYHLLVV